MAPAGAAPAGLAAAPTPAAPPRRPRQVGGSAGRGTLCIASCFVSARAPGASILGQPAGLLIPSCTHIACRVAQAAAAGPAGCCILRNLLRCSVPRRRVPPVAAFQPRMPYSELVRMPAAEYRRRALAEMAQSRSFHVPGRGRRGGQAIAEEEESSESEAGSGYGSDVEQGGLPSGLEGGWCRVLALCVPGAASRLACVTRVGLLATCMHCGGGPPGLLRPRPCCSALSASIPRLALQAMSHPQSAPGPSRHAGSESGSSGSGRARTGSHLSAGAARRGSLCRSCSALQGGCMGRRQRLRQRPGAQLRQKLHSLARRR